MKKSVPLAEASCVAIARSGIKTSTDFAALMSAMMTDLAIGTLTPQVGNAMCNTGGKLLKVIELQQRYGTQIGDQKVLRLTSAA